MVKLQRGRDACSCVRRVCMQTHVPLGFELGVRKHRLHDASAVDGWVGVRRPHHLLQLGRHRITSLGILGHLSQHTTQATSSW